MGRKRRKIIRRTARAPPKVFACPLCGAQAVTVTQVMRFRAVVSCGKCGVSHEVPWLKSYMPVDAYSTWYDIVTGRVSPEKVREKIERLEAVEVEALQSESGEPVEVVEEGDELGAADSGGSGVENRES
ncbi:hypothetical protein HRbin02_00616 [Candidatus Calditenuaceae archaeon HR02]|nr:hypothetical protein HRbin02_00616 [Candidatus Calditenuaceae archaeon HR02]